MLAISHLHNAEYHALGKGPAKTLTEWQALFPDAITYDEDTLLWQLLRAEAPFAHDWIDWEVEAFSFVEGAISTARPLIAGLTMPLRGATLRRNPLMGDAPGHEHVRWPSERYRKEYQRNSYWANPDDELPGEADPVRLRRLVDLPERW